MIDFTVNYLWVFILSVLMMVFGALWYSPLLFGKLWMKLSGAEMKKKAKRGYILGFVGTLVMFAILDMILTSIQAATMAEGAILGLLLAIGFAGVITLNNVLWGGQSPKLWLLNLAHYALVLVVTGAVLAVV